VVIDRKRGAAWLSAALLFFSVCAAAAPVADEDRTPLDLRRTTLVVSDIEASLAFYRDALGMVVTYDNLIFTPRDAGSVEAAERASRLVFLRANDDYIGVLGLIQYLKPDRGSVDISDKTFHTGTAILVINHEDARAAFERASAVEGANAMWEPTETAYPSYDGKGKIRVLTSGLQDPDGFVIEVNELLDEL
jgi:catechol 2,3-dioxygenase-like lactoylglutathione lyase family enzyme